MSQPSYPFASARVKSHENALLDHEKVMRLVNAGDAEQVMKLLADFGYDDADETEPVKFEKCLFAQMEKTLAFVQEITPDVRITDLFFLQYDYHNLKAILKSEARGVGAAQNMLVNYGTIEPKSMYEKVREKQYSSFPQEMKEALEELDRRFSVKVDVSDIPLILDRAYASQITRELENVKEEFVHEFFRATFDFANIGSVIRLKRVSAGKDVFDRALLPGGSIALHTLKKAYDVSLEDAMNMLSRGKYQRELSVALEYYTANGSFAMLEKVKNDYLSRLAAAYRPNLFSIAPVLGYLVEKTRELQIVRMIMVSKLNGIESRDIIDIIPAAM